MGSHSFSTSILVSYLLPTSFGSHFDDTFSVWTYGTGLELNSPRFAQPGDFLTYIVFIATVILVSWDSPVALVSSLPLCNVFFVMFFI